MKTSEKMIQEAIWAGLNDPSIDDKDADILVLGVPYDGSVSFRSGAKDGPRAIREITYTIPPTTEQFRSLKPLKIKDLGDIQAESRDDLFKITRTKIQEIVSRGQKFTVIGGDHSITIPVLQGINDALDEPFGIIHIDAHFDLCDTLEGDRLSHGSTERRALELENVSRENMFFIGIRSIEEDELDFITDHPVNVVSAYDFDKLKVDGVLKHVKDKLGHLNKIYITLDIDCLDPAYAAGTGTPQFGGLTSRQLLNLLEGLFDLPIMGFDLVEVAPNLDPAMTSVFAARKIITECFGHFLYK
ncbi:agmatinase [Acidaminobacter sp. JC074]|uniref:agmatinase n=1 Tax=Acidaminobacter sp. JC074 TaxID=2530199 RepID=UPI001F1083BB|nr:agmatinase [Acidaminobacter sp. JC074]MCH4886466.1 agmatinase [Acidaminobacter sp. JC074]